jgi:hypothetical protein
VNTATFDVNLKRSLTDFRRGWPVVLFVFRNLWWNDASSRVPGIHDQILRFHGSSSVSNTFPFNEVFRLSDHPG